MLAILVVLMVETQHESLISLFLNKVRKHTEGSYRIYASVNHLSERQRTLAADPDVRPIVCHVGNVNRGREEHAALLQCLREEARKDGARFFVTMHIDSFPVLDGWDSMLRRRLQDGARFASVVPHGYSACLFWDTAFDTTERLPLLVNDAEREGQEFGRFQADFPSYDHIETGLNFIYQAWRNGWQWERLPPTGYQIYGNAVFHLVGGVRLTGRGEGRVRTSPVLTTLRRMITPIAGHLPRNLRARLREPFIDDAVRVRDGSRRSKRQELEALLQDPDAYLSKCRESLYACDPAE